MKMKKVWKRILALGLAVVMVLSYQVPAMAAQSGVTGSGTKENPYKISSAAGLSVLNQKDQYIYAQLENNIDLSQGTLMEGSDYRCYIQKFKGELDGNGYVISNAAKGCNLIEKFYGGELKNFTFNIDNGYARIAYDQGGTDHKYTGIMVTGNLQWESGTNNESPVLVYPAGNTTMSNVTLDLTMDSSTYHGLLIGYEPCRNSAYKFNNCKIKGTYRGKDIGILFGNGSASASSDYGLQHVKNVNGYDSISKTSSVEVTDLDLSEAQILSTDSIPHLLCGVSYNGKNYDTLETQLKSGVTGYGNMKKAEEMKGCTAHLNHDKQLKISVDDASFSEDVAYFLVVSEVYSSTFDHGVYNGTQKHSVVEKIEKVSGVNTYYSTLGKVKFHDSDTGIFGTTGLNGSTRTVTVDGKTYYALNPERENIDYTFNGKDAGSTPSNTTRESGLEVFAYDKNGGLINKLKQQTGETFELPKTESVVAKEGTVLGNVSLADGWSWIAKDTKVVAGGQTAFAQKGEEIAPVKITGYEITEPELPSIDLSKPADQVEIGANQGAADTVKAQVEDIVAKVTEGSDVADLDKEMVQKIEKALEENKSIHSEVVAEKVAQANVPKDDVQKIAEISKDKKIASYLNLSVVLKVDDTEIGNLTRLTKPIEFQIAVPKDLQKDGRTFSVVRVHNGRAETLTSKYEKGIVTFETDKFSTYALVYADAKTTTEAKPTPVKKPIYRYSSTRKIKVSWWRKKSADGFVIYAKAGDGKYKKIKTVGKKKSATVYVKSGKPYKFKVKAYRNVKKGKKKVRKYWKAYRASGKNQGKTIKVTYKNVTGYKGYVLYLKSEKKGYKKVKTTTKGGTITYTNRKAKTGTSYKFRLRGYKIKNGKRVYTTIKAKKY